MPSRIQFSVIIPTYNRWATLRQTLGAVTSQEASISREVIVVDDGSTDETPTAIRQQFPTVICLRQAHQGPAAARNHGIAAAHGEWIAFTDDDCLPPADWLARLLDGYTRYPGTAGVGGGLIAPEALLQTNIFAQYERYVGLHTYRAGATETLGGFECPAGGTANMSYSKAVLMEIGGFDTGFPVAAGEDADLKLRITQRGYKLLYVPVWVIHLQDYTWVRFRRQSYLRGMGRNYFEHLHGGGSPSRFKIALRVARRLMAFPLDLWRMPARLAVVKLADGLVTCQGQWAGK